MYIVLQGKRKFLKSEAARREGDQHALLCGKHCPILYKCLTEALPQSYHLSRGRYYIPAWQTMEMPLGKVKRLRETVNSVTNWVTSEWLHEAQAAASTVLLQGSEPTPPALEGKVLTTGPPDGVPTRFFRHKPSWKIDKRVAPWQNFASKILWPKSDHACGS